jgi:hypothetical protein
VNNDWRPPLIEIDWRYGKSMRKIKGALLGYHVAGDSGNIGNVRGILT